MVVEAFSGAIETNLRNTKRNKLLRSLAASVLKKDATDDMFEKHWRGVQKKNEESVLTTLSVRRVAKKLDSKDIKSA